MKVTVERNSGVSFTARSEAGLSLAMDGPPQLGGADSGMRPMEVVLAGLAGCSGIDVVMILDKQREPLAGLRIEVEAERADAVPAVFSRIHLRFVIGGPVAPNKLQRAVRLSMEKYCSVARMLAGGGVEITWEAVAEGQS